MKFARLLRTTAEDLPEMQSLFETYKQLKKQLKRVPNKDEIDHQASATAVQAGAPASSLSQEEHLFVEKLNESLEKFNDSWVEKEENFVMKLQHLQDCLHQASTEETRQAVYKELVDFHGELLLVLHWSILAYTGLVKILKKHHKRTGLLLRAPHLENLLSQPFCNTEVVRNLVSLAERSITDFTQDDSHSGAVSPAESGEGDDVTGIEVLHASDEPEVTMASGAVDSAEHKRAAEGAATSASAAASQKRARVCDDSDRVDRSAASAVSLNLPDAAATAAELHARCSEVSDCSTTDESSKVVSAQHAAPCTSAADASNAAGGSNASAPSRDMVRKTQVALGVWQQLQATATTPSTVLQCGATSSQPMRGSSSFSNTEQSGC